MSTCQLRIYRAGMRDQPASSGAQREGVEAMSKKQFYVYAIYVDGEVRYIGKGSNGRVHFHVIESGRINRRRVRGANTDRTATKFYRKLAEAMRHGATITEEIMLDGLTSQEAYRIEKQNIEELHKQNRDQLWNTIDERLVGITWEEYKRKRREDIARSKRLLDKR
jgi:hypothetical protein